MGWTDGELRYIYDRTSGYCHLCGKKLALFNYSRSRRKGGWEVDHSQPRSRGGTDRVNNLYPACINCNRNKGLRTTRTARRWHGRGKAPLSRQRRKEQKVGNAVTCGLVGLGIGSMIGPWGALLGGWIGAKYGYDTNPDNG